MPDSVCTICFIMKHPVLFYHPDDQQIQFIHDHRVRSRIIHILVLGLFMAMIISLPLVSVSVSIQNRGIIRPVSGVAEIRVIPAARVVAVRITEGQFVKSGDTLLILESEGLERKIEYTRLELQRTSNYILDLHALTGITRPVSFRSELYRTQSENFRSRLSEIDLRLERANRELNRQAPLMENQLISEKDYDEALFFLDQLANERTIAEASQMVQWKSELAKCRSERDNYLAQINQLEKQRDLYIIKSPVNGTIESFPGIYPDCNLQSGQVVAVISPENSLIAEVFVPAKHIGMLFVDMPVKLQIDAFDYNQWGLISGRITGISDDYHLVNNAPVFKVKCAMDTPFLRLKNGTTGLIKKGMTLNARFIITRRTLFQLLYQKSDDWLNPGRSISN